MTEPKTDTLEVPGAVLTYDVRSNDSSTEPVLLMIASPMGAAGFETLSGYFTDRTVVTYDPRGADGRGYDPRYASPAGVDPYGAQQGEPRRRLLWHPTVRMCTSLAWWCLP